MSEEKRIDPATAKTRLLKRLDELERLTSEDPESRAPVALDQASVGRLSRMDALQGQAMALEAERRRDAERRRVQAALARIDEGEYGFCAACGEPIAAKRLEFDPAAPVCVRCAGRG